MMIIGVAKLLVGLGGKMRKFYSNGFCFITLRSRSESRKADSLSLSHLVQLSRFKCNLIGLKPWKFNLSEL